MTRTTAGRRGALASGCNGGRDRRHHGGLELVLEQDVLVRLVSKQAGECGVGGGVCVKASAGTQRSSSAARLWVEGELAMCCTSARTRASR